MMKKVVVMMITPVLAASLFTAYKMSGGKNIPDSPCKIATISTLREREEKGEYAATEWPNNLQTQQIPEPPFEIVGENTIIEDVGEGTYEKACGIHFTDVSRQDVKTYVKTSVKSVGFVGKTIKDGSASYHWQGKNANKLSIDIEWYEGGKMVMTFFQN